ncbi:alpha-hydroxy-acid oxidizing protein [Rubrobacter calidifluminis]|uniref:alpha-hydroxy-acid oxidizing protein n=1 Tax=Rubrobacter calidifluminis TaxID=1392640 RepID=UPI002361B4A3|nr:alpha-hydroxy-acid oxidizing protein [Rubrobacter calidifluminis]
MIGRRIQQKIYLEGLLGKKPVVPTHPDALERAARRRMSRRAWAYVAGGAGLERTMARNRAAFDRYALRPRMLRGAGPPSLEVGLFGRRWAAPLFLCPIGVLELAHPDADLAVARAAAGRGVPVIFSNQSSRPIEAAAGVMDAVGPDTPRFFQLYHPTERRVVESFLRRAESAGCAGVVLTVDTVQLGWRPRDLDLGHLPFLEGRGLAQYVTDPEFMGSLEDSQEGPSPRIRPSPSLLKTMLALRRLGGGSLGRGRRAVQRFVATYSFPELSWDDVRRVREATALPLLLKGILHPEDAARAVELGVDGIVVSNHGGRQVDGAISSLEALPQVARAVGGRVPVLMDGGVRTGADVVKALALGARAVGIGRPYVYGLALAGAEGVGAVIDHMMAELELTLALSGVAGLEEVGPDILLEERTGQETMEGMDGR